MEEKSISVENQPRESSIRVEKDKYLSRLSEIDKKNLTKIEQLFEQAMKEKGYGGALFVVGGSIIKPLPRKDIDVVMMFESTSDEPKSDKYLTPYKRSLINFGLFRNIVEIIIKKDSTFRIKEIVEPAIDEEFGSESIVKHDGSIEIKTNVGMPIEFIPSSNRKIAGVIKSQRDMGKPYVLLTRIIK